jgi:glucose-6-phosphate 1-dehydrogenase
METPPSPSAADLQHARETAVSAFRPLGAADVVLGQFEGYPDIDGVPDDSVTDTFAAVRLWVDTDRWRGVPFLLRTGEQLAQGDRSLFTRPDGLAAAWDCIAPVLDARPAPQPYPRGSWGPDAAEALAAPHGWLLGGDPRA